MTIAIVCQNSIAKVNTSIGERSDGRVKGLACRLGMMLHKGRSFSLFAFRKCSEFISKRRIIDGTVARAGQ